MRFDRGELGRLVDRGLLAVEVADDSLQRRGQRDHQDRHAHHRPGRFGAVSGEEMACAGRQHDEGGGEVGGEGGGDMEL